MSARHGQNIHTNVCTKGTEMGIETIEFLLANYGNTVTDRNPKYIDHLLRKDGFICNYVCTGDHWLINLETETKPYRHVRMSTEPNVYRVI